MVGENIPKGIHEICYENHLVYAHSWFTHENNLVYAISLKTVSSKSIAKDLSSIIHIEGKLLQSSKVSHLVKNNKITDACSLTNILANIKVNYENISKSLFDITSFIDSVVEAIEEDSTMDEVTTRKMLVLIEQFMTIFAVTLLTPILR